MSDTKTDQLDPEAGFTNDAPSVSDAANDLRSAAGAKAKEIIHTAETKASKLRETAAEKASQLRETATTKATAFKEAAGKQAGELKVKATEQWDHTRVRAKELHGSAEDYIRDNPTKCVLGALGIGFLAGLIMRR
ncbi:MAG: hypothetical protein R3242_01980 [Akkermansiaceae bacterium]|nr:hypothetical protein [Akkermansiaceae bacterium]